MTPVDRRAAPAIMVVAGEASGDLHGGALCRALGELAPDARLIGMGGTAMAAAGVTLLADVKDTAVVGFSEVVRRLPALRRADRRLRDALRRERPAALVLIDFPGLNLRMARAAARVGVPVVYFVPPQVWAWRPGRLAVLRRHVALVLAVLPFERALYQAAGVPVAFVGHPIVDALAGVPERAEARRRLGVGDAETLVGLLPGSRDHEVDRLLPVMRDAAARIAAARPGVRFALGLAPTVDAARVTGRLAGGPPVEAVRGATYLLMRAADLLLVASGTATLEAALLGTPMAVCYRVSRLTETLGRWLVRVPWISLVNLVLGRAVVPELYRRSDATGERLAAAALRLLAEPAAREAQREAFRELADQLGRPGVGRRAARLVLDVVGAGGPSPGEPLEGGTAAVGGPPAPTPAAAKGTGLT